MFEQYVDQEIVAGIMSRASMNNAAHVLGILLCLEETILQCVLFVDG